MDEWPENDYRIFVGDLGNECNDDVLAKAFQKYPSFVKARVRALGCRCPFKEVPARKGRTVFFCGEPMLIVDEPVLVVDMPGLVGECCKSFAVTRQPSLKLTHFMR